MSRRCVGFPGWRALSIRRVSRRTWCPKLQFASRRFSVKQRRSSYKENRKDTMQEGGKKKQKSWSFVPFQGQSVSCALGSRSWFLWPENTIRRLSALSCHLSACYYWSSREQKAGNGPMLKVEFYISRRKDFFWFPGWVAFWNLTSISVCIN